MSFIFVFICLKFNCFEFLCFIFPLRHLCQPRIPFALTQRGSWVDTKGVGEKSIVFRHALREGILPVVTYSGPLLADLMVGSFVVENLFQIPGIGVFLVNSSINRDYTMVVGLVILYSVLLLILNLLVDVIYGLLDKRVKYV